MTPNTNTPHDPTINHRFLPAARLFTVDHRPTSGRRTSPVLSVQELQQLVRQMVD